MSMRRCVSYCLLITVLLITAPAQAQQPKKVRRIGYLGNTSSTSAIDMKVFRERLNELAYIEGQNIFIEWRFAEDKSDRYADFAADLVRLKLDVMVAANAAAVGALKRATQTIAIVMESYGGDPLADGIVASFAKPGGNITGMTPLDPELSGKQLELLKETLGKLHLLAVLWNPNDSGSRVQWQQAQTAAKDVAIQLTSLEVRTAGELERAVESATRESAAALLVLRNALFYVLRNRIVTLAERNRLPECIRAASLSKAVV